MNFLRNKISKTPRLQKDEQLYMNYFFLVYTLSFCIVYINCHQCTYFWQRMNCIYFAVLLPQLHFLLILWKKRLNSFCFQWFFYVVPVSSYTAWIRLVLKQSVLTLWYSYCWLLSGEYLLFHRCLQFEKQTCIKWRKS